MNKNTVGFYLEDKTPESLDIVDVNNISLGELADGFVDNSEKVTGGVFGWNGNLEIRPKFQRAYVVEEDENWKADLVHSVLNNRPIGVMYFWKDQ